VRLGLVSEADAAKLSDAQSFRFVFTPGFTTAPEVTSVSGRGVGMDVVKSNIDQIGGTIDIKSTPGQGTTLRIKIPLTLAIVSALIVDAHGERFAIPQIAVVELVNVNGEAEHKIEKIKDATVLRLREQLLPVVHLSTLLKLPEPQAAREDQFVVVMQIGSRRYGVAVDQVLHTEEIVVKPISAMLRSITLFSGNTILGDGSVIMILDPNGVAGAIGVNADATTPHEPVIERSSDEDSDASVSLLVFRAGSSEPKAVPISLVTRIEEIDARRIELSNGRHVVQYRESLMPLLPVDANVRVRSEGMQPLLVFIDKDRSMGLVVDEIIDIVKDRLDIKVGSRNPGVLGSAIIDGHATEIIDIAHYLPLAFEDWLHHAEVGEGLTKRVLLVDDSTFFRNMLSPVLKAAGYEVKTAAGGAEALAVLDRDLNFDFVICDIEMPGVNGFEVADRLRADPRTQHLRLIALSSHHSPAIVERGREAGFGKFVAKFDRDGLLTVLKERQLDWARAA
jgi:two-component system chemotaxis sensor kinase CheA